MGLMVSELDVRRDGQRYGLNEWTDGEVIFPLSLSQKETKCFSSWKIIPYNSSLDIQ